MKKLQTISKKTRRRWPSRITRWVRSRMKSVHCEQFKMLPNPQIISKKLQYNLPNARINYYAKKLNCQLKSLKHLSFMLRSRVKAAVNQNVQFTEGKLKVLRPVGNFQYAKSFNQYHLVFDYVARRVPRVSFPPVPYLQVQESWRSDGTCRVHYPKYV